MQFSAQIRPILSDNCFACHGPDEKQRKGGLRLDTRDGMFAKGESEAIIIPGDSGRSELFRRLTTYDASERMPPAETGKQLTDAQIDLIRRWIDRGAEWGEHWSFVPPVRPAVPDVDGLTRADNPIDRFVSAKLDANDLTPSPPADRVTLIRRLHFDLIGLPPSVDVVDRFVGDANPHAYEQLVDELLASPHFGERMAIHWLDLVRYADTVGYHGDQPRSVGLYRDYVINAFNANMPFDRFTVEQLAGDLLPEATVDQKIAAGFNMLGMTTIEGGAQAKEYLAKYAADRVRTTSGVWMAATLGCAECHNHKFDPYTTKDFYRFAAFFADIQQKGVGNPEANLLLATDEQQRRIDAFDREIAEAEKDPKSAKDRIKQLKAERAAFVRPIRQTIVPVAGEPRITRVLARGDWLDESGEIVLPGAPAFMKPLEPAGERADRLDFARWLVDREHPQTARVFVNRLWKMYFGSGLSRVLDEMGSQGEAPSHPALLDWLAVEFIDSGWNIKHVVRLMVTSRTYRQSSLETDALRRLDPANRLLARQSRFRLEAELIRDNALAVSGLLVTRVGGDSVYPYQPDGYYAYLNFPKRKYVSSVGENQYRRGVYTHWQRTFLHPMLLAFDAPSREECTAERPRSNTPLAALTLLNDPTFVEAARALADRIVHEGGTNTDARLAWAWRQVLSRRPNPRELARLEPLLDDGAAPAAWTAVARVILNLNESITRN